MPDREPLTTTEINERRKLDWRLRAAAARLDWAWAEVESAEAEYLAAAYAVDNADKELAHE
jgi:hypothetical protein